MGYFFEHNESVPTAIRRILAEQLDQACRELDTENANLHDGIHNARRCFKKIQSLLHLIRGDLDPNVYDIEENRFKHIGQQLSKIRDSEAIIEAYDRLNATPSITPEHDETVYRSASSLKATLEKQRDINTFIQSDARTVVHELAQELKDIKSSLELWPIAHKDISTIAKNFSRNYKKGRKALKCVYASPSIKGFHNWRKKVKIFEHQCYLLKECWPEFMEQKASDAKSLESLLGQDHDLSILRETLNSKSSQLDSNSCDEVKKHAQQRQLQLRTKAHKLGKKLYKTHPMTMMQNVSAHWKHWKNPKQPLFIEIIH
jgi:CHAD domain-containing protein